MAHEIAKSGQARVHQVLHGYRDGHRQLATSFDLAPRDAKAMLVLSDMSAHGTRLSEKGYITGYPLVESSVYALARTWPAPEMSRPGCVWTHTLLIDLADLATLRSLNSLLALFRRPEAGAHKMYSEPLEIVDTQDQLPFDVYGQYWVPSILKGLYEHPKKKIIATRPNDFDVEQVLVNIWAQQWPRLRRNFRFCSFATSDRSIESHRFDIQLIPPLHRSMRSMFPDSVDADMLSMTPSPWIGDAISDLDWPDIKGLRSYFRVVGADITAGREVYPTLCRLYTLTNEFGRSDKSLEEALELVKTVLAHQPARGIKRTLLSAMMLFKEEFDADELDFVRANWNSLVTKLWNSQGGRLFLALWRDDPVALMHLIGNGASLASPAFLHHLEKLDVADVVLGLKQAAIDIEFVLRYRRDVVKSPTYWAMAVENQYNQGWLGALDESGELIETTAAMIQAGRSDLAHLIVRDFNIELVMEALVVAYKANVSDGDMKHWIHACITDPNNIAEYLSNGKPKQAAILELLARTISPDTVPNDFGNDPWLLACGDAKADLTGAHRYLAAFLVTRALGPRSRNAADLLILGFDSTLSQVEARSLDTMAREQLEYRLPISFFTSDPAELLIRAVANVFVDKELWPPYFSMVTRREDAFFELVRNAKNRWLGSDYLHRVYEHLVKDPNASPIRVRVLEKLLDIDD